MELAKSKGSRISGPETRVDAPHTSGAPVPKKAPSAHLTNKIRVSAPHTFGVPVPSKSTTAPVPLRGGKTQARSRTIVPGLTLRFLSLSLPRDYSCRVRARRRRTVHRKAIRCTARSWQYWQCSYGAFPQPGSGCTGTSHSLRWYWHGQSPYCQRLRTLSP